jgi:hypothetical protein
LGTGKRAFCHLFRIDPNDGSSNGGCANYQMKYLVSAATLVALNHLRQGARVVSDTGQQRLAP